MTANPIVQNGVVYVQDLDSNVYALALATGKLRVGVPVQSARAQWTRAERRRRRERQGLRAHSDRGLRAECRHRPDGLGQTGISCARVRARSASSRRWRTGGSIWQANYGSAPGGGVLLALNASSGAVLWRFNTVTGPEPGVQVAWSRRGRRVGDATGRRRRIGHVRHRQSVSDRRRGDRASGGGALHRQRREPRRRDREASLVLPGRPRTTSRTTTCRPRRSRRTCGGAPVVIGSGKMGYVYEMNAATGEADLEDPGRRAQRPRQRLAPGAGAPSTLKAPFTILPGSLGGVLTDLAVAGNSVYVVTFDLPLTYTNMNLASVNQGRGPRDRRGGGAQPRDRQGRMGHEGAAAAARCRHGVERPRLHHAVQR